MTNRRAHRRDQELLQAALAEGALARLLADASAPGQPHELEGLSAALTAFSTAPADPRRSRMKPVLSKLLAVKAVTLAATVGAVSISGVALAAATGSLPATAQNAAHDLAGAPAAAPAHHHGRPAGKPTKAADDGKDDTTAGSAAGSTPGSTEATPDGTPSPSLFGLCHAYTAGVASSHGKALENPAFTVLITAAGGKDSVQAYCTALLAMPHGGKPTTQPTVHPTHAQDHPTGRPSSHPTHPAHPAHPTSAPSTHPTGPPATHSSGKH